MIGQTSLMAGLRALPSSDRALLKGMIAAALGTFVLGVVFGSLTALIRAGFVSIDPETGYRMMTLHGVNIFFYWLYFAQAALLLAFATVYSDGAGRVTLSPAAWTGFGLMLGGLAASLIGTTRGTPLLYDGSPELASGDMGAAGVMYGGYLLLAAGLFLVSCAAIVTALKSKGSGQTKSWSAVTFGTVAWAGLVMVSAIAAANAFLPPALWTIGWGPAPENASTGWHILFHNMHYLPLMGTVLVWYVLVRELTGVTSVFGDRFSKIVFSLYLIFVPPTSLYHMFLEPNLAEPVRVLGSLLSLFISVPTVAMFLVIVASLEIHARKSGATGLFAWLKKLPWREPAIAAVAAAVINLALGGMFAFVLIQEKLAGLLSDTFFVPGYFHFLTVGTVSLTFLAGLGRLIPPLSGGEIWGRRILVGLPYLATIGLVVFGLSGIVAGAGGMPRRALDITYDGAGPTSWGLYSALIGTGGAVMALALLLYATALIGSLFAGSRGRAPSEIIAAPSAAGAGQPARQVAWTGPLSVAILVGGMYIATAVAFKLMRALPIIASGGGGH